MAAATAAFRSRPVFRMRQRTPVVPARCAPARQWMRTAPPEATAASTKSKTCAVNARTDAGVPSTALNQYEMLKRRYTGPPAAASW